MEGKRMKNEELNKDSHNVKRFEQFEVWKKNHELVLKVYQVTRDFSVKDESLVKELQKTARQITQSIVEGFNRRNPAEKYEFYARARDASFIFQDALLIANDLKAFINESEYEEILEILISGRRMLNGLLDTFRNIKREAER